MKQPGIEHSIVNIGERNRKRRGDVTKTALVTSRNAFSPSGANYDLDAAGNTMQGINAPNADFDAGQEVVFVRGGDLGEHKIVAGLADTSRAPTQARQSFSRDVTLDFLI